MPFRGTGKEAQSAIGELSLIVLLDEPVLLVYDAELGSTLIALCQAECIASYSIEVTVKSSGNSTRESHGDVSIFAHHAALLNGEQWKLRFQGCYLAFIPHIFAFFG